jgi:hypothetical protein
MWSEWFVAALQSMVCLSPSVPSWIQASQLSALCPLPSALAENLTPIMNVYSTAYWSPITVRAEVDATMSRRVSARDKEP